MPTGKHATCPDWWFSRGVIASAVSSDGMTAILSEQDYYFWVVEKIYLLMHAKHTSNRSMAGLPNWSGLIYFPRSTSLLFRGVWIYDGGIPPNAPRPYEWKCRITVPGGGLQARTGGEFDFMAPTDGYLPSDEINMSADTRPWNDSQSRQYFIKFANGTYARIDFTMAAGGDHFFSIVSYLNPAPGHRNLEYDPKQTVSK